MIDLTRRRFLKFASVGALTPVVLMAAKTVKPGPLTEKDRIPVEDVSIESQKVKFDPNSEYGRVAECNGLKDSFVIRHLHRDAKRVLPKGTPYDIRLESTHGVHVNRETWEVTHIKRERRFVCWFYAPEFTGRNRKPFSREIEEYSKPYVPPSGVTQDRWKWIPEYGAWMRGMFYA